MKADDDHQIQSYRPDIDGLRAIAVLSVVAYHAFPETVKGGFIGVDVFFVISGYLIGGIILRDLDQGTFSFWNFGSSLFQVGKEKFNLAPRR